LVNRIGWLICLCCLPLTIYAEEIRPRLFATGLVGNSAIAAISENSVVVANYRNPGTIARISEDDGASVLVEITNDDPTLDTGAQIVGLTLDRDQRLIALDAASGRLLRWNPESKGVATIVDRFQGRRFNSLFATVLDKAGNFYFTVPESGSTSAGQVYRFDATTNQPSLLAGQLVQPTGICFGVDRDQLFVAESGNSRIVSIQISDTATESKRSVIDLSGLFEKLPATDSNRIGHLAIDRRGWLYVALWDHGVVAVVDSRGGQLLELIPTGGKQVFGIAVAKDWLWMSIPEKEAIYRYDLRALIGRHAP